MAMARYADEGAVAQSAQSYYHLPVPTGLPWSGEIIDLIDDLAFERSRDPSPPRNGPNAPSEGAASGPTAGVARRKLVTASWVPYPRGRHAPRLRSCRARSSVMSSSVSSSSRLRRFHFSAARFGNVCPA
jgi:hypothetical protein